MTEIPSRAPRARLLAEPLAQLADFTFEQAAQLCDPAHDCCRYHRAWSMIRFLLLDGALPEGADLLSEGLAELQREGRVRVLLSGAADTGLAALVLAVAAKIGQEVELVLAERCATPIAQNRRFAEALGIGIELHQGDISALDCAPVDVVIAHNFLTFLPPDARPGVVATWARVLRPGGLLLMRQRFAGQNRKADPGVSEADRSRLEAAARDHGYAAEKAREIGLAGQDFWMNRYQRFEFGEGTLRDLLAGAGFELVSLRATEGQTMTSPAHFGRTRADTPKASVIARKPG